MRRKREEKSLFSPNGFSPNGLGVVAVLALLLVVGDELWERHLVKTDVQSDSPCHEEVVVLAFRGSITAVLPPHISDIFIQASLVALDVEMLPHHLHQCGYDFRLCFDIGVETIFHGCPTADVFRALSAGI